MAIRISRQRRKNALITAGFLNFEAHELSKIEKPMSTPYIANLILERASAFEQAKQAGLSATAWRETIREMYKDKGYETRRGLLGIRPDPWKMLRAWEDRFKDRQPDYTSPWQKKPRKKSGFDAKYEAGQEKYPRGRAYHR